MKNYGLLFALILFFSCGENSTNLNEMKNLNEYQETSEPNNYFRITEIYRSVSEDLATGDKIVLMNFEQFETTDINDYYIVDDLNNKWIIGEFKILVNAYESNRNRYILTSKDKNKILRIGEYLSLFYKDGSLIQEARFKGTTNLDKGWFPVVAYTTTE